MSLKKISRKRRRMKRLKLSSSRKIPEKALKITLQLLIKGRNRVPSKKERKMFMKILIVPVRMKRKSP